MGDEFSCIVSGREIVISISGYLDKESGRNLGMEIETWLAKGFLSFVLDFSHCPLVNSLGLAAMIQVTLRIKQDFAGRLAIAGLDALKRKTFDLAGLLPLLEVFPDAETALAELRAP